MGLSSPESNQSPCLFKWVPSGALAHDEETGLDYRKDGPLSRIPRSVTIYGSKVGRGSCSFVENLAAIDEGRRVLSARNRMYRPKQNVSSEWRRTRSKLVMNGENRNLITTLQGKE